MRTCRQRYDEAVYIVYESTIFKVTVRDVGTDFLKYMWGSGTILGETGGRGTLDEYTEAFPFHLAKQIYFEVWRTDLQYSIFDLRENLVDFCSILERYGSLRSIRVDILVYTYKRDGKWVELISGED